MALNRLPASRNKLETFPQPDQGLPMTDQQNAWSTEREYTAWELAGDWSWLIEYEACTTRQSYETVTATGSGRCALRRLEEGPAGLRTITRYVEPETKLRLRQIK